MGSNTSSLPDMVNPSGPLEYTVDRHFFSWQQCFTLVEVIELCRRRRSPRDYPRRSYRLFWSSIGRFHRSSSANQRSRSDPCLAVSDYRSREDDRQLESCHNDKQYFHVWHHWSEGLRQIESNENLQRWTYRIECVQIDAEDSSIQVTARPRSRFFLRIFTWQVPEESMTESSRRTDCTGNSKRLRLLPATSNSISRWIWLLDSLMIDRASSRVIPSNCCPLIASIRSPGWRTADLERERVDQLRSSLLSDTKTSVPFRHTTWFEISNDWRLHKDIRCKRGSLKCETEVDHCFPICAIGIARRGIQSKNAIHYFRMTHLITHYRLVARIQWT